MGTPEKGQSKISILWDFPSEAPQVSIAIQVLFVPQSVNFFKCEYVAFVTITYSSDGYGRDVYVRAERGNS